MEIVTFLFWLLIVVLAAIIAYRILGLAPISPLVRGLIEIFLLLVALILLIQWVGPLPPPFWMIWPLLSLWG